MKPRIYAYDSALEKSLLNQDEVVCLDEKSYLTALFVAIQLTGRGKKVAKIVRADAKTGRDVKPRTRVTVEKEPEPVDPMLESKDAKIDLSID